MKPIKHNGLILRIEYDTNDYGSPRENFETLGKMYCWHARYRIGDKNPYRTSQDFWEDSELQDSIFACRKVYMYEHGGVALSDAPFGCRWDSGVLGIVYATKEAVKDRYGDLVDRDIEKTKEHVMLDLSNEIEDYHVYLNEEYKSFVIEGLDGEILECSGAFGYTDETTLLKDMKDSVAVEYYPLFDKAIEQVGGSVM